LFIYKGIGSRRWRFVTEERRRIVVMRDRRWEMLIAQGLQYLQIEETSYEFILGGDDPMYTIQLSLL
jgi:hypothetical protein